VKKGRLRELSFRQVQEGTGNALDIDSYDRYYRHLILWDEDELEIIGSYRIGEAANIIRRGDADVAATGARALTCAASHSRGSARGCSPSPTPARTWAPPRPAPR